MLLTGALLMVGCGINSGTRGSPVAVDPGSGTKVSTPTAPVPSTLFAYFTTRNYPGYPVTDTKLVLEEWDASNQMLSHNIVATFLASHVPTALTLLPGGSEVAYVRQEDGSGVLFRRNLLNSVEVLLPILTSGDHHLIEEKDYSFNYRSDVAFIDIIAFSLFHGGSAYIQYVPVYVFDGVISYVTTLVERQADGTVSNSAIVEPLASVPSHRPGSDELLYVAGSSVGPYVVRSKNFGVSGTDNVIHTDAVKDISTPAFLPDGSAFVVSKRNIDQTGPRNLILISADGSSENALTTDGGDVQSYSPSFALP